MGKGGSLSDGVIKKILLSYAYVAIWIFLSFTVIVYNKYILDKKMYNWPFPVSLTMIHMSFCATLAFLLIKVFKVVEPVSMSRELYLSSVVPIGALYSLSLWLSNSAYIYLSVSFIQMLKALMPVAVYSIGVLFKKEGFKTDTMVNMLSISFGVAIAAYGEARFDTWEVFDPHEPQGFLEDYDSNCSTPYVSAPSSPGLAPGLGSINGGFYYSAPASPMHFAMTSSSKVSSTRPSSPDNSVPLGYEFEFSGRFGSSGPGQTGSMTSADELFLNGKIRPMKLSTHLERPQVLAPLMDLEHEDDDDEEDNEVVDNKGRGRDPRLTLKAKSLRRRTRSMSPLRNATLDEQNMCLDKDLGKEKADIKNNDDEEMYNETSASMSASSSRSSSAGRSSKRWVFLKDFLRSKSEGTGRSNNKFWSTISFSPTKEKKSGYGVVIQQQSKEKLSNATNGVSSTENQRSNKIKSKPVNGIGIGKGKGKRRVNPPSPHELLYTANRAQAEEMRKKTFLPYKQGLFGCLSFSSKGYGAMNGLTRALNPVSSS